MLAYWSLNIICSSQLTVFFELRSRKTVRSSEQIMFQDKYFSIFLRQMEAIVYIFPNFQNCTCCEKYLKGNKHNSLHLARKYAGIFVRGHYLFREASSRKTVTFEEQILSKDKYPRIFSLQINPYLLQH